MSIDKKNVETKVRLEDELTMKVFGPLYISPSHMKPGFHYVLPTNVPGNIEYYMRLGYEVVKDEMSVGDQKASQSSPLGAAVTVQSKDGILHVLMACTIDRFEEIEAIKHKIGRDKLKGIGHVDGVASQHTIGTVNLGSKKI